MRRILLLLVFMYGGSVFAQISSKIFIDGKVKGTRTDEDSLSLHRHLNELQTSWVGNGYYFSGVDSIVSREEFVYIYLHKGEKRSVRIANFGGKDLAKHLRKELKDRVNNGYPFASVRIDSMAIREEILSGKIIINPGPEVVYDTAFFFEDPKTNRSYIYQLLDIQPRKPFSERNYSLISSKINRSPFLSLEQPTDLSIKSNKAQVFLDISESTSSTFQGVLGLQQQNGKATVVGSLELDIQNLFRSGKRLYFFLERFSEQSQSLNVLYKHPFFLDSKLSPIFRFDLLKQDTTFLTRAVELGFNTYLTAQIELNVKFERFNGTLLSNQIETISQSGLADFGRSIYGLEASSGIASSLSSYKEGLVWRGAISGGLKTISKNLSLPDSYYDSIQLNTNFYLFEGELMYQVKTLKRQTFYHRVQGGILRNDEILTNELYRLGGLSSMRGFNEKSIFAKNYLLSRMEFRSFFENESYAYVFYDQLIYKRNAFSDHPFGIGLGFVLATSAGQFSFALAAGNAKDKSISFSSINAHFGYISRF